MTTRTVSAFVLLASTLLCSASVAAEQKPLAVDRATAKKRPLQIASVPAPQGFSVVLVLGEMQGTGATEGVPAAARKALADMKDFLPYKGYRFLDTQWTLCCGRSATVTRLRGPEEQEYDLELSPSSMGANGKWYVRFALRDPIGERAPAEVSSADARAALMVAQKREMEGRLRSLRESRTETHPDVQRMQAQIAQLERALTESRRELNSSRVPTDARSRGRAIIDTSFTMEIGETVVVGTSRLKGDKALIALLTAVPSSKTSGR
jgi:hypothetical protein